MIVVGVSEDRPRGQILARGTQGNLKYLHAFHRLCRKYSICPTYMLSYPAIGSPHLTWLNTASETNECELGVMSQSWATPPFAAYENRLTGTPSAQLSRAIVSEKLLHLREAFDGSFGRTPLCHMSDGWDLSSNLISALVNNGYRIDCSYAPGVSPIGQPLDNPLSAPYFPSLQQPESRGSARLVEVPIATRSWLSGHMAKSEFFPGIFQTALYPFLPRKVGSSSVIQPSRDEPRSIWSYLEAALSSGVPNIVLPIQSYELGIGSSDLAASEDGRSDILQRLDQLFRIIVDTLQLPTMGLEAFVKAHLNGVEL